MSQRKEGAFDMIGTTSNLKNLVAYQDGSIVSREIIKKPAGTVTILAFDKGQGLSEHTAPFDALVYVSDGEAEITISGNTQIVKEGDFVIMPANQPHAVQAKVPFKMMLIMVKG